MKRKVISLHVTDICNNSCPFCYRKRESNNQKPHEFFIGLVPYLAEITEQVALGGGELYYACPEFVEAFSKECSEHGLICNATTNGTLPDKIIRYSKYLTMVSISIDRFKVSSLWTHLQMLHTLNQAGLRVGSNLLIDNDMFNPPTTFIELVDILFRESERVFALYPKNWEFVPILNYKNYYAYLTAKYEHFYIDDLTYQILTEARYREWSNSCHYGTNILNINSDGTVTGCSFSSDPLAVLTEPKDVLKLAEINVRGFRSCPYLAI